jgi:UDP-N-acetylmuramate--alanine ligase
MVPGVHNVLNALAAIAVGLEVDVGFGHIAESLAQFRGVGRRFETRGEAGGVRVVDDYGHHPTEIRATLAAARTLGGRVFVLFQPHRFTRTVLLRDEFGSAFADAERVWVLDVYAAGEPPIPGVSGRTVVDSATERGATHVTFAPDGAAAAAEAAHAARAGDIVLTLGAGDVWRLGDDVLKALEPAAAAGRASGR